MESLSKPQILALLQAAQDTSDRDWLMIGVGFLYGLRASEVVAIKPHDIRDGYLTVRRLKGSNRTRHELTEDPEPLYDLRAPLIEYAESAESSKPLFPRRGGKGGMSRVSFWRMVKKHGLAAGIPEHLCTPKVLKHSIAMQTIGLAGIENVRQHLGHVSMSSTGEYLKVSDAEAGKAITNALHGLRPV